MDYQTKKVLKYINKYDSINFSLRDLQQVFPKIDLDYLIEIIYYLNSNNYIKFTNENSIRSTNKGRTFIKLLKHNWLAENIIDLLALIIAILALVLSIVSLILQYIK